MELSYSGQLHSTGLFETHEKVNLKLKAIETISEAARSCDSVDVKDEIEALAQAVMKDLGFEWNHDDKMYDYNPYDDPFSDEL